MSDITKSKSDTTATENSINDIDSLFVEAEHLASNFSLFRNQNPLALSLAEHLEGLVDNDRIKVRLEEIKKLSVDDYIEQTILPAQHSKRPGAKDVVAALNGKIIVKNEVGPFFSAEIELQFKTSTRRVGIIAQERSAANGSWMPEHHRLASDMVRHFAELSMPIVYLIDTPGADAGEIANSQNQAHSISQLITETTNVDVPTVGIVIGIGYSGGAIPLAAANILLSARDGIFNTIQPSGLQSIARKFNLSWQECAKSVGVSPEELCAENCLDGIIDFSPTDRDDRQNNLQRAIISSIESIEAAAINYVRKTPELMDHYQRSVQRHINPTEYQSQFTADNIPSHAVTPTDHLNIFGLCYRYLRYLSLRSRIHSISNSDYGRLSKLNLPEGDLDSRLQSERNKVFNVWLENPDKLVYDDQLAKLWKKFLDRRKELESGRSTFTKIIFGQPEDNYQKAIQALLFHLSFNLFNRWKNSTGNNFKLLIALLQDEEKYPLRSSWPETGEVTILDVIYHEDLRSTFIANCKNILIFDSLYNNIIDNLVLIAKEAMDTKALSKSSIENLLKKSLERVLGGNSDDRQGIENNFENWLKYFVGSDNSNELLTKVEEWKSIGFPHMNDNLLVILTYFFEQLLPEYYNSVEGKSFSGAINPVRIGRRKDFWNRLIMGYRDLLISRLLKDEKRENKKSPDEIINHIFTNFNELDADKTSSNPVDFPGFRQSIETALDNNLRACGLVTGIGEIAHKGNPDKTKRVGIAISNLAFQAGSFDMASGEKFCRLLVACSQQKLPVICFISSGGMQTKEGAASLFSMAVLNSRITRFVRDNDLPIIMFGFGDCTGGAQASFVTHPLVQTYYFSGCNMPFAGQMVVPAYLPSTSTLSNYLSTVPGAMIGLVEHPFSADLDKKLREIDPLMPLPNTTINDVIDNAISSIIPKALTEPDQADSDKDPKALMKPIDKVLVHARGCTAVKLIRKAHESNINVVLVASDPDMISVPALMLKPQDKLVCLGGNSSAESYLNAHSILKVAEYEQVNALHPGIGFLSENPNFAAMCIHNKINFVGPIANSMRTMGNKSNAIHTVQGVDVPVVPGSHGILTSAEQAADIAEKIVYPVLLKAVHGGGGKGIQVVKRREEMFKLYDMVSIEARAAFGNGDLYLEKFVVSMRHIEVQLLRDSAGNSHVLGIRDCSVQRNNQKMIEESDCTMITDELKQQALDYTLLIADAVDYTGAGTVEFIYDLASNAIYFMEMNTRLQVEHPVTEATSGVDIVKEQFNIASGNTIENLPIKQEGYAIELRIIAEKVYVDAEGLLQLMPTPGLITKCVMPEQSDMEVISIAGTNMNVSPFYDSLIAQIICHGESREDVINKLYNYLDKVVVVEGISTNIPLLKRILKDNTFNDGAYDTSYLPKFLASVDADELIAEITAAANSGDNAIVSSESIRVESSSELKVIAPSSGVFYTSPSPTDPDYVKVGDIVTASQTLALMEAMKMFSQVTLESFNAPNMELYPVDKKYRIERINNTSGQQVSNGDLLFIVSIVQD